MKTDNTLLLWALLLGALFFGCKKDDDADGICMDPTNPKCGNYDPCHGVQPPSAAFTIQESYRRTFPPPTEWLWTPDDSIFVAHSNIRFSSPYTDNKYKHTWYLGAEVIHDASFTRDHGGISDDQRPYHITVSHVIEYPLDNECYANATGKDSVARTYTLIKYLDELKTFGVYRGAFEGQRDSFDFAIRAFHANGGRAIRDDPTTTYFINFHNEGDTLFQSVAFRNRIVTIIQSFGPRGLLQIEPNSNQFTLEYRHLEKGGDWDNYTVRGRKLNLK
jgi:hypothetical protein